MSPFSPGALPPGQTSTLCCLSAVNPAENVKSRKASASNLVMRSMEGCLGLEKESIADAKQEMVGPQVDAPAADGRGGEGAVGQVVGGHQLELRAGLQHVCLAGLVGGVQQVAHQH